jgi:group I intron endonuclease
MSDKVGYIYIAVNRINGKIYVGQTVNIRKRLIHHKCNGNKNYFQSLFDKAIVKYGSDQFQIIRAECPEECLNYWESFLIKNLNSRSPNGYNLTDGGDGVRGRVVSEEQKEKMRLSLCGRKRPPFSEEWIRNLSESRRGEKNPNYGKTHTAEARQKISEAHKGKPLSEDHKRKIGDSERGSKNPNYGKAMSEETKGKLAEAHRGKALTAAHRARISAGLLRHSQLASV